MRRVGAIFTPYSPPEALRDAALAAEASGVPELWLWEDCFRESAFAAASAVLAWTTDLRVGIGVAPMPLRNVALTAMEIATIERLFPGASHPRRRTRRAVVDGSGRGARRLAAHADGRIRAGAASAPGRRRGQHGRSLRLARPRATGLAARARAQSRRGGRGPEDGAAHRPGRRRHRAAGRKQPRPGGPHARASRSRVDRMPAETTRTSSSCSSRRPSAQMRRELSSPTICVRWNGAVDPALMVVGAAGGRGRSDRAVLHGGRHLGHPAASRGGDRPRGLHGRCRGGRAARRRRVTHSAPGGPSELAVVRGSIYLVVLRT